MSVRFEPLFTSDDQCYGEHCECGVPAQWCGRCQEWEDFRKSVVHIRLQQRNARKCVTTTTGLDAQQVQQCLRVLRRSLCCSGTVVEDDEYGNVLMLTGDQREAIRRHLIATKVRTDDKIFVHGA